MMMINKDIITELRIAFDIANKKREKLLKEFDPQEKDEHYISKQILLEFPHIRETKDFLKSLEDLFDRYSEISEMIIKDDK